MQGVYFFTEPGEFRATDSNHPRIVRVGTHAVSTGSKTSLRSRLRAHLGSRNGNGNHRGSIFRLHVGAALLIREGTTIPSWGQGSSIPKDSPLRELTKIAEMPWERKVSQFIGSMGVLWVDVPDTPSTTCKRAFIERNAIALLSNKLAPRDPPSREWLGRCSPREDIRNSGLWNLKHVHEQYDPMFLDVLEIAVEQTLKPLPT